MSTTIADLTDIQLRLIDLVGRIDSLTERKGFAHGGAANADVRNIYSAIDDIRRAVDQLSRNPEPERTR